MLNSWHSFRLYRLRNNTIAFESSELIKDFRCLRVKAVNLNAFVSQVSLRAV